MNRKMHGRLPGLASFLLAAILTMTIRAAAESPGLIVEEIAAGSGATKAGIIVGDKLLAYYERPLASPAALQAAQQNSISKGEVTLRVQRGAQTLVLTLPEGLSGISVRPEMPPAALELYREGRAAERAQRIDQTLLLWAQAAKAAERGGDANAAGWLYSRIGEIEGKQWQWAKAQESYAAALKLFEETQDTAAQSRTMEALGRCNEALSKFVAAQGWYDQALHLDEAAGNEMWVAADLMNLGNVAKSRGQMPAAQAFYTRSLTIRERLAPDSLEVSDSLNGLGNAAFARRDLPAAQAFYIRALRIRERKAPDTLILANTLNNLGLVARLNGELRTAKEYHRQALALRQRLHAHPLELAGSYNSLGVVALDRGEMAEAEEYLNDAYKIYLELKPASLEVAGSLNNLGILAYARGDLQVAEDYYNRALTIRQKLEPGSLDVAHSLNNLGIIARLSGNLLGALEKYCSALEIFEKEAPNSLEVAGCLNNLGIVARARGDLQAAEDYYQRAFELRKKLNPNSMAVSNSLNNLGNLAYDRGDLAAAQYLYNGSLMIREDLAPGSLELADTLNQLGYLALKNHRLSEALQLFKRSVEALEAQRSTILSPDSRALLVTHHTSKYTGLLQTYLALDDWPGAFAVLESARGRSLIEMLSERRLNLPDKLPADLQERQEMLAEKRSVAIAKLTRLNQEKDSRQIDQLRDELTKYSIQQRELENEIRRAYPKLAALHFPEPLDLEGAQKALDPGTLLLAYYISDQQVYLFAVTQSQIHVYTLPIGNDALNQLVIAFRNEVGIYRPDVMTSWRQQRALSQGQHLYDLLLRPAQAQVASASRLLICAEGPLNLLPFAALVSQREPRLHYLIDDKPLHMIISMTVYEKLCKEARSARQPLNRIAVFADPVYSKAQLAAAVPPPPHSAQRSGWKNERVTETDTRINDRQKQESTLEPLPWTRKEALGIRELFGASAMINLGQEATETTVKKISQNYPILHFAVHGLLNKQVGLDCALALSQPEALGRQANAEDNGLLQAWEVFEQLQLKADLVVLSACDTGIGQDLHGEGLIGLTRAFQYAGAKSLLVSLWGVNDESTTMLMTRFYRELRGGASKDVALQRAMIALRNNSKDAKWRHPYYWSSFHLTGDWQ